MALLATSVLLRRPSIPSATTLARYTTAPNANAAGQDTASIWKWMKDNGSTLRLMLGLVGGTSAAIGVGVNSIVSYQVHPVKTDVAVLKSQQSSLEQAMVRLEQAMVRGFDRQHADLVEFRKVQQADSAEFRKDIKDLTLAVGSLQQAGGAAASSEAPLHK